MKDSDGTALASYTYDSRSRRTALDYVNGAGADYSYDAASQLSYVDNQTANGQHKYAYSYDYVGNRLEMTVTDGSGVRKHLYTYDDIYQITEVNYPRELSYLATDTTFNYDNAGNRTSVIDGSGTCTYASNSLNQCTRAGTKSFYYDTSGNMWRDATYEYSYDPENRLTQVTKPDPALQYLNNFSAYTKGGDAPWVSDPYGFAQSGAVGSEQESWMYIDVSGPGTVQFQWKVSSQTGTNYDYLEFTTDGNYRDSIAGEVDWQQKSFTVTGSGAHRLQWRYVKDSNDFAGDDCGWVKAVTFTPPALPDPDALAEALDCGLTFTTGGDSGGWTTEGGSWCYHNWDQANGTTCDGGTDWMQTTVTGAGTLKFWWMVSSEGMCDQLEFYIDGQLQDDISGDFYNQWTQKSYTVGAGTHTFRWQYTKNDANSVGYDRGWVDWVQWSGTMTEPATTAWSTLNYVYDASGRRIEKQYDGKTVLKYLYDGDHCIAEYGAGNDLHRKYVYGPGVDQPICLIEAAGSYAGTYYYHFDGLGSVVALTNASGNTVQTYDYSVYGQVGALDGSHPNRLMFTGREFDKETGLYYYRARYYKPEIGRFLQADEVGYEAGMNLYRYCSNNPWNSIDPYGLDANEPNEPNAPNEPCIPISPIPVYPPIAGPDPAGPPSAGPGSGGGGDPNDPNDPNWNCTCTCCGSGGPGAPGFGPPGWINPSKGGRNKGRGDDPAYVKDLAKLIAEYEALRRSKNPDDRRRAEQLKEIIKHRGGRHHGISISTCVAALAETMRESSQDLKDPHNVVVLGGCVCLCVLAATAVIVVPK